jgi:hypothetical protein
LISHAITAFVLTAIENNNKLLEHQGQRKYLPYDAYREMYRTIRLDLPRKSGVTTAVCQLAKEIPDAIVLVRSHVCKRPLEINLPTHLVFSQSDIAAGHLLSYDSSTIIVDGFSTLLKSTKEILFSDACRYSKDPYFVLFN